jgi:hypothetical protein
MPGRRHERRSGTGSRRDGHEGARRIFEPCPTRRRAMGDIPRPLLTNRFTDAIDFALVAHCAQVRKGTRIPYLSHLLAVASANILAHVSR